MRHELVLRYAARESREFQQVAASKSNFSEKMVVMALHLLD
jgi:hypothetical protein